MGLLEQLDITEKRLWKSIDVINEGNMEEPHILQQQIIYPTTSMKTETNAPTEKHRLIPLSQVVDYSSFKESQETDDSEPKENLWNNLSDEAEES
ncbi:hypothetical protein GWK26_07645 [haloarchaeon 3A1-DGR]|nr:hypothetical protein GWK26_07645 [haloarchaeon 3A1-DGR]